MLTVILTGGRVFELDDIESVDVANLPNTTITMLVCRSTDGQDKAKFKLAEVAGYYIHNANTTPKIR